MASTDARKKLLSCQSAFVLIRLLATAELHRQQADTPKEALPLFQRHRPHRKAEARLDDSSEQEHGYGLRKRPHSADHDAGRR